MVRRLGLGKNNHLTYASLALNPRNAILARNLICYFLKATEYCWQGCQTATQRYFSYFWFVSGDTFPAFSYFWFVPGDTFPAFDLFQEIHFLTYLFQEIYFLPLICSRRYMFWLWFVSGDIFPDFDLFQKIPFLSLICFNWYISCLCLVPGCIFLPFDLFMEI